MYASKEIFGDLVNDVGIVGQMIGAAGKNLRNFFIRKKQAQPDPGLLKTRELQSAKIQLRLLGRQGKYGDILEIATSAEHDDIARLAVLEIVEGKLNATERIQFLAAIADSFSKAAVPATVVLYNQGEFDLALSIFLERLANSEMARLIESGKAKLLSVLDLLGALDVVQSTSYSSQYFDELFKALANSPEMQVEALMEILGDPKPSAPRGLYSSNSVTQDVKMKAMNMLQYISVEDKDRALSFACKDEDDLVAHRATMSLINMWQSQNANGMLPQGLESFPLLNTNLLTQVCQMASSFKWTDGIAADELLHRHAKLMAQLSAVDGESDPTLQACLQKQLDRTQFELRRLSEYRVNQLQPLINKMTQALGIPNAALSTSDDPAILAAYVVGGGCIELSRRILFDDEPLSEDLLSTLLHELGHMEQDVLIIRMIADDLNLKFGQHADLLYPLYERYASGIGYAPQSMFLLAVLRLRADKPLNESQRQRALRLHESSYLAKLGHEQLVYIRNRANRLNDSYEELDDGKHDSMLLTCLINTKAVTSWFSQGAVPAVLLYEIESCKQDLFQIYDAMSLGPRPKDIVGWATKAYKTDKRDAIEPIVQRLRTLLMQILNEECQRLDKEMSDIRRSGYHESEAYLISDRVEVIVKALRRGW
ncbi:MAG TPA: hypothetical protein V6C86_27115 [Oculatellaceae cyanobacterium]